MKRIFFIIWILACCIQGHAKTLRIDCLADSIQVAIDSRSVDAFNMKEFIGTQIDSIYIYESPILNERVPHKIAINNLDIITINAKEWNRKKLEHPFSIMANDELSVYRSNNKVGQLLFKKPIDISDIQNYIYIEPIYPNTNNHFILKSESDTLLYMLNNPKGYLIDSILICDIKDEQLLGAIKYNSDSKSDKIGIPVSIKNAKDSTHVQVVVTSPILKKSRIPIEGRSVVAIDKSWFSLEIVLVVLGILALLVIAFILWRRRKTKTSGQEQPPTKYEDTQLADSTEEDGDDINNENRNNQNVVLQKYEEESCSRMAEYTGTISRLEKLVKEYDERERRNTSSLREKDGQIRELIDKNIRNEQLLQKAKADKTDKHELRDRISKLNGKIRELTTDIDKNEKQLRLCRENLKSAESSATIKDKRISELNGEKDKLTSRLKEEQNKCSDMTQRLKGFSKQTHYLYLIDEALDNIEKSLPLAFGNVTDETLRRKLVDPIVIGTPGLDESGMESYKATWRAEVYDNQVGFFGKDVLQLSDADVVATLKEKFIENFAMRDSFNKLVRLYLFSNVGWLNIKLVEAGFDIDAIQTLFIELKNLFDRFGVKISYPHLFIDIFDETQYRDSRRCDIFSIFEPTPEVQAVMRAKAGESLIVDLVRIGLPLSNTPTRRIPMVSLPNF